MKLQRARRFIAVTPFVLVPILLHCSSNDEHGTAEILVVDAQTMREDATRRAPEASSSLASGADTGMGANDAGDGHDAAPPPADASSSPPCLRDTLDTSVDAGLQSDGGVSCTSSTECEPLCEHVLTHYRPGVAQEAARCIRRVSSCTRLDVLLCVDRAIARACRETSAVSYCTKLRASCFDETGDAAPELTQDGCERFASAFSTAGREVFANCIDTRTATSGCSHAVIQCAEEIRQ